MQTGDGDYKPNHIIIEIDWDNEDERIGFYRVYSRDEEGKLVPGTMHPLNNLTEHQRTAVGALGRLARVLERDSIVVDNMRSEQRHCR